METLKGFITLVFLPVIWPWGEELLWRVLLHFLFSIIFPFLSLCISSLEIELFLLWNYLLYVHCSLLLINSLLFDMQFTCTCSILQCFSANGPYQQSFDYAISTVGDFSNTSDTEDFQHQRYLLLSIQIYYYSFSLKILIMNGSCCFLLWILLATG